MSNLKVLIKNNLNCFWGAFRGKKGKKSNSVIIGFCVLGYLAICALIGLQFFALFDVMSQINLPEVPFFNSMQVAVTMLLVLSFQQLTGKARTEDSDLLLSLPLRKIDIIISKTFSKYLFNLMLSSMIFLPTMILYFIYFGWSITVLLIGLLMMFVVPLLAVGINYILNFLLVKLFNKNKFSHVLKTIFAIVIYSLVVGAYIYNATIMGTIEMTTIDDFLNSNFLVGWLVKAIVRGEILSTVLMVLLPLFICAIGIFLYAIVFGKSYSSYKNTSGKIEYKSGGYFGGLLTKEFKKYLTTPIYMFNTIIAPLLLCILTVVVLIKGKVGIQEMFMLSDDLTIIYAFLTLISLFMSAMTLVSCCSISLEGKSFWMLKSLPVDEKKVFLSKAILNMIVYLPLQILSSIIILIVFGGDVNTWILFVSIPMLSNVILSFGGVYINLLFPKLNFESEQQVVKQSMSVFVSMIFGMLLTGIPVILSLFELSYIVIGYITLVTFVAILIATLSLLFTHGKKLFQKIDV